MALPKKPVFETMNITEARRQFSETLNRVHRGETRVLVEKSGIPVGAIISMDDFEKLQRIDEARRLTLEAFADAQSGFEGVPEDEIETEIEKAIAEVEEEWRMDEQKRNEKKAS